MPVQEFLKLTRDILAGHHIKWKLQDHKGNYCVWGAMDEASRRSGYDAPQREAEKVLAHCCTVRHPELVGDVKPREDSGADRFIPDDLSAFIYVNDQLGEEAILADLDAAINGEC